jgi:hypothetical protein
MAKIRRKKRIVGLREQERMRRSREHRTSARSRACRKFPED